MTILKWAGKPCINKNSNLLKLSHASSGPFCSHIGGQKLRAYFSVIQWQYVMYLLIWGYHCLEKYDDGNFSLLIWTGHLFANCWIGQPHFFADLFFLLWTLFRRNLKSKYYNNIIMLAVKIWLLPAPWLPNSIPQWEQFPLTDRHWRRVICSPTLVTRTLSRLDYSAR